MKFLELFNNSKINKIGELILPSIDVVAVTIRNIMNTMGMSNPSFTTSSSTKGIIVKKKGNKYIIVLNQYDPPVSFTWTGSIHDKNLQSVIEKIAIANNNEGKDKIIAGINSFRLLNNRLIHQLAISQLE